MKLTFQIIERQKTLIVIEDGNPNFVASAQFDIIGDKAFAHSINGAKFYDCVRQYTPEIFERLGVRAIEAYVRKSHLRLLKMSLNGVCSVVQTDTGIMNGQEMCWIKICLLK